MGEERFESWMFPQRTPGDVNQLSYRLLAIFKFNLTVFVLFCLDQNLLNIFINSTMESLKF